jgi:hypothetical protein
MLDWMLLSKIFVVHVVLMVEARRSKVEPGFGFDFVMTPKQ